MELVCINDTGWVNMDSNQKSTGPDKGDVVTKTGEVAVKGKVYYVLAEWPDHDGGFLSTCFMPLNRSKQKSSEVTFTQIKEQQPVSAN